MKRTLFIVAAAAVILAGALGAILAIPNFASAATGLSATEAADLQYAREEEKLARDVYGVLDGLYGDKVDIFANIYVAESRHTLAVKDLLDRYGVEDPVAVDDPGIFQDDGLQELYWALTAQGDASLQAALQVGVVIEELDIGDLSVFKARTTHRDIRKVYGNLIAASENHLASFNEVLAK